MSYKELQRFIRYIVNITRDVLLNTYIMMLLMHNDEAERKHRPLK